MTLPFSIEGRPGGEYYIAYHDGGGHMADLPCRHLIAENRAIAERADAAEAENARLREERGTLICTGSLAKPEYTPLGEMLRQVDNQRIEDERRADALHKALRYFALVPIDGHIYCDECSESWPNGTTERHIDGCLATPSAPKGPQQT